MAANETSITLHDLKYSTRYKFYFSARTLTGPGPSITEEFATITDTGMLHLLSHEIRSLHWSVACDWKVNHVIQSQERNTSYHVNTLQLSGLNLSIEFS